jgi:RimJ/RimL family protein N-acetyltransferase
MVESDAGAGGQPVRSYLRAAGRGPTGLSPTMPSQRPRQPVRIRPFQSSDVDPLFEAVHESIEQVSPWLAWCHARYSREEAAAWVGGREQPWAEGSEYSFAIVDSADGRFLGGCGLNQIHPVHRFANLGYWVRSSAAGRGVATQAALLTARFAFVELGLIRAEIVVDIGNAASIRVAEKMNAVREGVARNRLVTRERVSDAVMFSLIPEDLGLRRLPARKRPAAV